MAYSSNLFKQSALFVALAAGLLGTSLSVHATDAFDPGSRQLTIDRIWAGGRLYTEVKVIVDDYTLLSADADGTEAASGDSFDPESRRLILAAVTFQGHTYFNVHALVMSYSGLRVDGLAGVLPVDQYVGPSAIPDFSHIEPPRPFTYQATGPDRSACAAGEGQIYQVGPNRQFTTPGDVPWIKLMPCDQVQVFYRPTPYNDKIFIGVSGQRGKAIVLQGMPGPNGERPIFDGTYAAMAPNSAENPHYFGLGMITMGAVDNLDPHVLAPEAVGWVYGERAGYWIIDGLEIANAWNPNPIDPVTYQPTVVGHNGFVDTSGRFHLWGSFVAGLYLGSVHDVRVSHMHIHNNSVGMFMNSVNGEPGQSSDILFDGNVVYGNGTGAPGNHDVYVEGRNIVHQNGRYGPSNAISTGVVHKDRSVCLVIRNMTYVGNGGTTLIDLRDPQSNAALEMVEKDAFGEACVSNTFIYGNTLVGTAVNLQGPTFVNSGDGLTGGPANNGYNRYGNVYFVGNTVVNNEDKGSFTAKAVPLFDNYNDNYQDGFDYPPTVPPQTRIYNGPTTFVALNNLFYAMPATPGRAAAPFAACNWQGLVDFSSNWTNLDFVPVYATAPDGASAIGLPCTLADISSLHASAANPGFVDLNGGDYRPTTASPLRALNAALPRAFTKRGLTLTPNYLP